MKTKTREVVNTQATVVLDERKPLRQRARVWFVKFMHTRFRVWIVAMAVVAVVLAIVIAQGGWMGGAERWLEDRLQRSRFDAYANGIRYPETHLAELTGAEQPPERGEPLWPRLWDVLIVKIDERSIRDLDGTPFTPTEHARVIDMLSAFGADVVTFDLIYSERREKHFPEGQGPLLAAIEQARKQQTRVIFASKLDLVDTGTGESMQHLLPLPELQEIADHGIINLPLGSDDVIRDYQYRFEQGYSLALATYLAKAAPDVPLNEAFRRTFVESLHVNGNPHLEPNFLGENPRRRLLNFYAQAGQPFLHLSYIDVYRAHVLIDVRDLTAKQAEVNALLADEQFTADWALLQEIVGDDLGPKPTLADLKLERISEWDEKLLNIVLPDDLPPDSPAPAALDSVMAVMYAIFDAAEKYWNLAEGEARAKLEAERQTVVKHLVRQRPRIQEILAQFEPETTIAATPAPTPEEADAAFIEQLSSANLPEQQEVVANALKGTLTDTDRAFLENVQADYESVAFIDRQIARVSQYPIPPDADEQRLRDMIAGKAVLVGPWTLDSQDLWNTPVSGKTLGTGRTYGVELHATALQNLFEFMRRQANVRAQRGISRPTMGDTITAVLLVTLLACLVTIVLNPLASAGVLGFGIWLYWLRAQFVFVDDWHFLPLMYPVIGAVLGYVLVTVTKVLTVDQERRLIEDLFKNYMDRRFVEILKSDPEKVKLGGEKREITVFFSDIAGFSGIAEKLSPEELILLINEYLGAMTEILLRYDATIDKYMGDAIMGFWNAPVDIDDHAAKACWAALEQRERLADLQKAWRARNLPAVDCRIGINTGLIVHGNMGSDLKKNYTLMGDDVNLAARFEPLNKDFGTYMIIGQRTWHLAEAKIDGRRLGKVQVKGRHAPTNFYELIARKGELTDAQAALIAAFHAALKLFDDGKFAEAKKGFEDALRIVPDDPPSQTYAKLCEHYLAEPPELTHWNGVYVQTSK